MPASQQNYFRYFATTPEAAVWGLDVTAAGYTRVPKGSAYPLAQHPVDHDFRWEQGRVLDAMRIVLIAGRPRAAFSVLAAWQLASQPHPKRNRMSRAVDEAEHYLAEHYTEPVNIEQLARRLGVAYSHFRRAFCAQTGFAPWQYMLHLRLSRAKRMIASSEATLDEIAVQLNFNSAPHLSLAVN